MAQDRWWPLGFVLLLLTAALLLGSSLRAQTAPRPPEDLQDRRPKTVVVLDRDAAQLAEDYLALLEQLQFLARDYHMYFAELNEVSARQNEQELRRIAGMLYDSNRCCDYVLLSGEVTALHQDLLLREDEWQKRRDLMEETELYIGDLKDNISDLQEELQELADELDEYDDDSAAEEYKQEIRTELAEKKERLLTLRIELRSDQKDITDESVDPKFYRLSRSLRRELEMVSELLEEDITARFDSEGETAVLIQTYVKNALSTALDSLRERTENYQFWFDTTNEGVQAVEGVEELPPGATALPLPGVTIAAIPTDVATPVPPAIPEMDVVARSISFKYEHGETGVRKELVDSAEILSAKLPIYIVSPVGALEIEGWDRDWIVVRSLVELSADARPEVENLASGVDLALYNKNDAIYVESIVPALTDLKTCVVKSSLQIKVPTGNPLICNSSFGQVSVSGFTNEVKLSAAHSEVKLTNLHGKVKVVGDNGRMTITDVTGELDVRNSYQPLDLSNCHGTMRVENAFSSISVTDCGGEAVVRNNGSVVKILDFIGTLDIENSNGPLIVRTVEGDLIAQSSMQPVTIRDVSGSVVVVNTQGDIDVQDIDGSLSATNFMGLIRASSLGGPLDLVNSKGRIDLILNRAIRGASKVMADFGTVNLRLTQSTDLLLTVETVGGNIESNIPVGIDKSGVTSYAKLELGDAGSSMTISGNSTGVIIHRYE